jgi:hypothetical protein
MTMAGPENPNVRRFRETTIGRATNTQKHTGIQRLQDPPTRQALAAAGWVSGGYLWPGGEGRAERDLEASNFGLPVERESRSSNGPTPDATNELAGASYSLVASEQAHKGDPVRYYPPHGVPRDLPPAHIDLLASAPWMAAVPGTIVHAVAQSRTRAFAEDLQQGYVGEKQIFSDRRHEGRRYRPSHKYDLLPQDPYPVDPEVDWTRGF